MEAEKLVRVSATRWVLPSQVSIVYEQPPRPGETEPRVVVSFMNDDANKRTLYWRVVDGMMNAEIMAKRINGTIIYEEPEPTTSSTPQDKPDSEWKQK